jgi:hypothetical protein
VRRRLELEYGAEARLVLESSSEGTRAVVELPLPVAAEAPVAPRALPLPAPSEAVAGRRRDRDEVPA